MFKCYYVLKNIPILEMYLYQFIYFFFLSKFTYLNNFYQKYLFCSVKNVKIFNAFKIILLI